MYRQLSVLYGLIIISFCALPHVGLAGDTSHRSAFRPVPQRKHSPTIETASRATSLILAVELKKNSYEFTTDTTDVLLSVTHTASDNSSIRKSFTRSTQWAPFLRCVLALFIAKKIELPMLLFLVNFNRTEPLQISAPFVSDGITLIKIENSHIKETAAIHNDTENNLVSVYLRSSHLTEFRKVINNLITSGDLSTEDASLLVDDDATIYGYVAKPIYLEAA